MRDESQNALLKTLEEPPDFVHLILLSSEPERAAGDDRLALPADRLRPAAAGGRRSGAGDGEAPAEELAAAARLSAGDLDRARFLLVGARGPGAARGGRAASPPRVAGEPPRRPGEQLLEAAEAVGEEAEAATREALEEEAEAGVKRSAKDIADEAKRAGRRRRTETLDLGLELCASLVPRPRRDRLRRRRGRLQPRPPRPSCESQAAGLDPARPAAPPSWSRTPAAASTSTSPRS